MTDIADLDGIVTNYLYIIQMFFLPESHKHCAAQADNSAVVAVLFLACLSRCGHDSKLYGKP